jgi:hypothetical protein
VISTCAIIRTRLVWHRAVVDDNLPLTAAAPLWCAAHQREDIDERTARS